METKMTKCSRFNSCNILMCPLDDNMTRCIELKGEPVCPLRRITELKKFRKGSKPILPSSMRALLPLVPKKNLKPRLATQ